MNNIFPVLLLFGAIMVIIIIIARRLPDITAINTDTIPEARTAATKRRLLLERLDRKMRSSTAAAWQSTANIRSSIKNKAHGVYKKLVVLEQKYRQGAASGEEEPATTRDLASEISELMRSAVYDQAALRYGSAENKYLEIIKLDHQNIDAYRGLGIIYSEQKLFNEAHEALGYALRLKPEAANYAALGALYIRENKLDDAFTAYEKAVTLEPNTDYLDRLVEVCILLENKRVAKIALMRLQEIDPEYSRLNSLKTRVAAMGPKRTRANGVKAKQKNKEREIAPVLQ